ncbi:DUF6009 family protein [Streptomyces werraensis]|uniref:DUF6009 family protein n=1 Tax=Streptomyces werraensis TaxID=68284 RepID=UPI001CE38E93
MLSRDRDPGGLYARSAPAQAIGPCALRPPVKGYKTERSEGGSPFRCDAGHGDCSVDVARPDRHCEKNLSQEAA